MNPRSLRFRLVAWYAGWLTLLFLVFGVFVYASLGYYLKDGLREALARRTRQVADLVQRSPLDWSSLGREIQSHFAPEANNRFTRVMVDGTVRYVSDAPSDRSFDPLAVPQPAKVPAGETFELRRLPDGTSLFMVVLFRPTPGKAYVIEEGSAQAPIQSTLHAWLAVLVVGLALLIVGAVLGGVRVVHRALHPVDEIIRSAERISSHNLSERLPVAETRDEIERLSNALNQMIRRLEASFQHTQRFLEDASHELRTPLTVLQAELEQVIERIQSVPELQELAGSALEEVERLRKIVEGLFALVRLEAGEALECSAPFDLAELVESTSDQMALLAEDKRLAMTCHAPDRVIVEGDRARLKQVAVNLLDNAIKYTSSGGRIEVRVGVRGSRAVLEVADTGIGIPAEAAPLVFDRFFRVDKARSRDLGGAGLGLSIVKSICTAHAGSVRVQSVEGVGSTFTVELPWAGASA
jgi:heavy metal sensor kinase